MQFIDLWEQRLFAELLGSLLADFILAFAFFTALAYAVLERRFGHQRPAVVMSASLGLALSVGLVWWEGANNWSIRDLGLVAVGFALIVLAGVMFQAFRHIGGNWAGAGVAFGASLLIGWMLGVAWPIDGHVIQTAIIVAFVVGTLAFMAHRGSGLLHARRRTAELGAVRHDMGDLYEDRRVAERLRRRLARLRDESLLFDQRPDTATQVRTQLRRILPEEGWLTNRLARLRERAHLMRSGHAARFEETRDLFERLPAPARRKLGRELKTRYAELQLDLRLERLDNAVAETERRVRELTRGAEARLAARDYQKVPALLDAATKLQKHNARLIRLIERTEARLLRAVKLAAKQHREVSRA